MTATKTSTLIVEDDADTFEWIRRRIKRYGFEATWARGLAEGMAMLDDEPCCLILDLSLPDGSGTEILRRIREQNLPIKVAVVSGTTDPSLLHDASLLKPDAMFLKPVDSIELVTWLRSTCP